MWESPYRRARSFCRPSAQPFPEGPDAFSSPESTLEICLKCAHLSEAGREKPKLWREPQFSPLLPGRERKLRNVGGLSIADATSQAVARDLALHPQAETPLWQKGVGCDKQLPWLQTGP